MAVPAIVQHWIDLRKYSEEHPSSCLRVLPITQFDDRWFFIDARLHELRNVENPADTIRFETDADLAVFLFQHGL